MSKNKIWILLTALIIIGTGSVGVIWFINSRNKKKAVAIPPSKSDDPITIADKITSSPVIQVLEQNDDYIKVLMSYQDNELIYQVNDTNNLPSYTINGVTFDAMIMPGGIQFFILNEAGKRVAESLLAIRPPNMSYLAEEAIIGIDSTHITPNGSNPPNPEDQKVRSGIS
jgi:hypothetical protein